MANLYRFCSYLNILAALILLGIAYYNNVPQKTESGLKTIFLFSSIGISYLLNSINMLQLLQKLRMRQDISVARKIYSFVITLLVFIIQLLLGYSLYTFFSVELVMYYNGRLFFPPGYLFNMTLLTIFFLTAMVQVFAVYPIFKSIAIIQNYKTRKSILLASTRHSISLISGSRPAGVFTFRFLI